MKTTTIKKNKITTAVKATLPFFAMLGGNAFASSRLGSTSNRRSTQSVVYVADNEKTLETAQTNTTMPLLNKNNKRSAFGAFTKNSKAQKTVKNSANNNVLAFLQSGDLLSAKSMAKAQLSGNLLTKKNFSYGLPFTTSSNQFQCQNQNQYFNYNTNNSGSFIFCNITSNSAQGYLDFGYGSESCQALHSVCVGAGAAAAAPAIIPATSPVGLAALMAMFALFSRRFLSKFKTLSIRKS